MVTNAADYPYCRNTLQPEMLAMVPRGRRLLDLGGGAGVWAAAAKRASGAEFAALVDISAEAVARRPAEVDAAEVVDLEAGAGLEDVLSRHGPFDLVLCLDVLEHLVDPWRVVARLHAALPEGAQILASVPNVQNYRVVLRAATGGWHYRESGLFDRTHLRFFSRRSAEALMTGTGLELVATGRAWGPARRDRLMAKASLGALGPWVAMQTLVRVRKGPGPVRDPGFCGAEVPFA